jgi:hypothetical protein
VGVGRVKHRDDGEQVRILGFERRCQGGGFAVPGTGNDLPLVDQIGVTAQGRGAPGIAFDPYARVRQRLGAHAHLHAGQQAGLAAVDAGHAVLGHPVAPGAVGQDHGLGHHQVQRRTALAGGDLYLFVAHRFVGGLAEQLEVVVRPVEVLGLAAHNFALGFEVLG